MRPHLLPALVLTLLVSAAAAAGPGRVALVIGNGGYQSLRPLDNPTNDARAVADKLAALGFTLMGADGHPTGGALLNLTGDAFLLAVEAFAQSARGTEIAFVYYAGHGMQIDGHPYLLPVDVPRTNITLIQRHGLALEEIVKRLDGQALLTLAVFDACREIPELDAFRGTGLGADAYRGLARVQQSGRQRIIAYAAAAGQLAADGVGRPHSPYTEVLLAELDRPGTEVGDLFRQVAYRLGQAHGGQEPEVLIQGVPPGRFFLVAPAAGTPPPPPPPAALPMTGHLQVDVNTDAEVTLDGRPVGRAAPGRPVNLEGIPIGEHRLHIAAPGYSEHEENAQVSQGQWSTVRVLLSPRPAGEDQAHPSEGLSVPPDQGTEQALALSPALRRDLQARLAAMGHYSGQVDGELGPGTRAALRDWQRAAGLPESGYLDRAQLARLRTAGDAAQVQRIHWESIQSTGSIAMLTGFLGIYPQGPSADAARGRIAALRAAEKQTRRSARTSAPAAVTPPANRWPPMLRSTRPAGTTNVAPGPRYSVVPTPEQLAKQMARQQAQRKSPAPEPKPAPAPAAQPKQKYNVDEQRAIRDFAAPR